MWKWTAIAFIYIDINRLQTTMDDLILSTRQIQQHIKFKEILEANNDNTIFISIEINEAMIKI
jgi:hypothetical protein